jgi:hypothetical protein
VTRAPEEVESPSEARARSTLLIENAPAASVGPAPAPPYDSGAAPGAEEVASVARGFPAGLPLPVPGGGWRIDNPEAVVKVSFHRIADQLPAGAFKVGADEVAAGLPEPGVLLVPQRLCCLSCRKAWSSSRLSTAPSAR